MSSLGMTGGGRAIGVAAILVSTLFETVGQLAFKRAADGPTGHAPAGPLAAIANWRWVLLGYAGFIGDGLLWSVALYFLDVSIAHPMGSLVFVVVAVASRLVFGEKISRRRWAGIGLILIGSAVVAAT